MSRDAPEMAFTAASLPLHSSEKKGEEEVKTNREWERAKASGRGKGRGLHVAAFVLIFIF